MLIHLSFRPFARPCVDENWYVCYSRLSGRNMCSVASRANNNLKICRPILRFLSLSVAIIIANRVDSLAALASRGLVTAKPPTSPKHHYKCIKSLFPLALSSSPFADTLPAYFPSSSRCVASRRKIRQAEEERKKKKKKERKISRFRFERNVVSQSFAGRIPFSHRLRKVDDH